MTVAVTADVLLRGQLRFLQDHGFDVTVITSPGPELARVTQREGVQVRAVPLAREISPAHDARSLRALVETLGELRPDIVNASTAKGGLLGMVASAIRRVPIRIYQLRGLRLETERGLKRTVLAATERAAASCATEIICNSDSLRDAYVRQGLAAASKCRVLGAGSANGVDVERFAKERWSARAASIRSERGIPEASPVIGFVGRLVEDKGMYDLVHAFSEVQRRVPSAHLLVVGAGFAGDVPSDALAAEIAKTLRGPHVHIVGRVDEPAPYYACMDVLAFPSHREGFPNAPLEAAAASVPTVGASATGTVDVIRHGTTGFVTPIGDAAALASRLVEYLVDPELRANHGEAARRRAASTYAREVVWRNWRDEYVRLVHARGLPVRI